MEISVKRSGLHNADPVFRRKIVFTNASTGAIFTTRLPSAPVFVRTFADRITRPDNSIFSVTSTYIHPYIGISIQQSCSPPMRILIAVVCYFAHHSNLAIIL